MFDIIVIGAGPAGLTAAIYARRANKTVLILDKGAFGGQMTFSPKLENYPGFESISGSELADLMVTQALEQGAQVEIENVIDVKDENGIKKVYTEDENVYEAKAVIIAAGAKHRHLGVEGEDAFIGDGISFCAVCDGAFYKDKEVILIGGGNSALQEAILLSETCKKVTVVQNLDMLTGEKKLCDIIEKRDNIEVILGTVVDSVMQAPAFKGIRTRRVADGEINELYADGMFVAIGLEPENAAFESICKIDERGYIASGEDCLTKTPGVFAAGDCRTKTVRQITTATADGAVSAVSACRYIDSL